jgi:hypothetical protein
MRQVFIMKNLLRLSLILIPAIAAFNLLADNKGEIFPYLTTGIVEYSGENPFRTQTVGLMTLTREQDAASGNWNYTTKYNSVLTLGNNQKSVQFTPPPLMVTCGPDRRRIVGGMDILRNFGTVGNAALERTGRPDYSGSRRVKLKMDTTEFYPSTPTFKVSYTSASSKKLGKCLIASAVSDMFACKVPDSDVLLTGTYRVIVVCDPKMENLYFRFCIFNSAYGAEKITVADNFWITDSNASPVDLADILPDIVDMGKTFPATSEQAVNSVGAPIQPWIVHALAIRKYMDTVAGVIVEGNPNPLPVIAVGTILTIDAAVSVGTKMLFAGWDKATGYNASDWAWPGIPSLIGNFGGWGAAQTINLATGKDTVNVQNWKTTGGDIASIAAFFYSFTARGAEIAGIKLIDKFTKVPASVKTFLNISSVRNIIEMINRNGIIIKGINIADGLKSIYDGINNQIKIWSPPAPGGLVFTKGRHPQVFDAVYQAGDNSFMINRQFKYRIPVPPAEFKAICRSVDNNHGFGYSLAGRIGEHYAAADSINAALNISDRFLGSVAFGNPDGIPAGCAPAPGYRSHPDAPAQAFPYCFNIDFTYNFDAGKDNVLRAVCNPQIGFIRAVPGKAMTGTWELDVQAQESGVPSGLDANARHLALEWPYYSQIRPVASALNYGEAAAFCMLLQSSGIKLNNLIAE